jgi:hypothetical protein
VGTVPILLVALVITVVVHDRFQEIEMMDRSQESAQIYADIIRESLVSMMANSQQVDTTFPARVRSVQQFDSLKVIPNLLKHRTEPLSGDQIARITRKKQWRSDPTDSVHLAVLEKGEPLCVRSRNRFRAVIPFNATKVSQNCHAVPLDYTLGAADIHVSRERFYETTTGNWRRSILIFVIFTVVAIAVRAMKFQRHISTPVGRFVIATREMQKRNPNAPFPQLNGRAS